MIKECPLYFCYFLEFIEVSLWLNVVSFHKCYMGIWWCCFVFNFQGIEHNLHTYMHTCSSLLTRLNSLFLLFCLLYLWWSKKWKFLVTSMFLCVLFCISYCFYFMINSCYIVVISLLWIITLGGSALDISF